MRKTEKNRLPWWYPIPCILTLSLVGSQVFWFFRDWFGHEGMRSFVYVLAGVAFGLGVRRLGARWQLLTLFTLALGVPMVIPRLAEQLHLGLFGILGFRAARRWNLPGALGVVLLLGVGDELFQALLPYRYFDWRDISFNLVGGVLGIWTARWAEVDENSVESDGLKAA